MQRKILALSLCLLAGQPVFAQSQNDMPPPGDEPGAPWVESKAPAPPSFSLDGLIPIYVGPSSSLTYGLDPKTLALSPQDGLVRYVIIARSASGTLNVRYEAIRCETNEIKTYAYTNSADGPWSVQDAPAWRDIDGRLSASYAQALVSSGICLGKNVNGPLKHMIDDLKRGGIPKQTF